MLYDFIAAPSIMLHEFCLIKWLEMNIGLRMEWVIFIYVCTWIMVLCKEELFIIIFLCNLV
ncbi:hypothetical protein CDL12_11558 [Handroanthus impetiginosus]|uniref:Uncharacterized protein n=1 Tax=Handroanthus impetiginosus TaxID=429701 RepID=A0A2G9HE57_9LAMI|nr:hypothetical protein CDL12_11558 [Handroanthus impetiginosus]